MRLTILVQCLSLAACYGSLGAFTFALLFLEAALMIGAMS